MNIYEMLQLAGGLLLCVGYIPQFAKIIRRRSVEDISIMYHLIIFFATCLMEIYALHYKDVAFMMFVTNSISLACTISMLMLLAIFRRR